MSELINQHQVATFSTPVNGTTADATVVLGNDNAVGTGHNAHDSDPGVHVQSSTLASRPAFGVAGRKWLTTDEQRLYYDTGSAWVEIANGATMWQFEDGSNGTSANIIPRLVGTFRQHVLARVGISGNTAPHPLVVAANTGLSTNSTVEVSISNVTMPACSLANVRITAGGIGTTQGGTVRFQVNGTQVTNQTYSTGDIWDLDIIVALGSATSCNTISRFVHGTVGPATGLERTAAVTLNNITTSSNVLDLRGFVTSGGTLTVDYFYVEELSYI